MTKAFILIPLDTYFEYTDSYNVTQRNKYFWNSAFYQTSLLPILCQFQLLCMFQNIFSVINQFQLRLFIYELHLTVTMRDTIGRKSASCRIEKFPTEELKWDILARRRINKRQPVRIFLGGGGGGVVPWRAIEPRPQLESA